MLPIVRTAPPSAASASERRWHAAFIDTGERQILSASPELFLRIDRDRRITTRPIKGTRPRGANSEQDRRLAHELLTDPKERAELLMITDLERNDLGQVCEYGSVHVPELLRLEKFAQVQHLISTVSGRLEYRIVPNVSRMRANATARVSSPTSVAASSQ